MTREEFNAWWQTFKAAYPEAAAQIAGGDEGGKATLTLWFEAFADVTYADADDVVRRMVRGDLPTIRNYERGETAAIIRKHAREIAYQRTAKPEDAPWRSHARRTERGEHVVGASGVMREPGIRAALEEYLRTEKAGASKADLRAMLRKRFPDDGSDRRERFHCHRCCDTGLVRVWSEKAIRACLSGTLEERANRTTANIPCECERGRVKLDLKSRDTGRSLWKRGFDATMDCPCSDVDDPESILRLERWCDERLNAKPANYVHEFDEWNQQAAF